MAAPHTKAGSTEDDKPSITHDDGLYATQTRDVEGSYAVDPLEDARIMCARSHRPAPPRPLLIHVALTGERSIGALSPS